MSRPAATVNSTTAFATTAFVATHAAATTTIATTTIAITTIVATTSASTHDTTTVTTTSISSTAPPRSTTAIVSVAITAWGIVLLLARVLARSGLLPPIAPTLSLYFGVVLLLSLSCFEPQ